jgi:hypothetical protein
MKALIVGLLSLTILSTSATAAQVAGLIIPPAGMGFCKKYDGIFVIVVTDKLLNDKGEQIAFVCPKIKGKPISQPTKRPSGLKYSLTIDFGEAKLLYFSDQPNPCIVWTIGSTTDFTILSTSKCAIKPPPVKVPPVPPTAKQLCEKYDGIFVILVNDEGEQNGFVCPEIKGDTINQLTTLPPGSGEVLITTPLGTAKKFKLPKQPDPCFVWTILGSLRVICW